MLSAITVDITIHCVQPSSGEVTWYGRHTPGGFQATTSSFLIGSPGHHSSSGIIMSSYISPTKNELFPRCLGINHIANTSSYSTTWPGSANRMVQEATTWSSVTNHRPWQRARQVRPADGPQIWVGPARNGGRSCSQEIWDSSIVF